MTVGVLAFLHMVHLTADTQLSYVQKGQVHFLPFSGLELPPPLLPPLQPPRPPLKSGEDGLLMLKLSRTQWE